MHHKCIHGIPNDSPDESYLQTILHETLEVDVLWEGRAVMEQDVVDVPFPCDCFGESTEGHAVLFAEETEELAGKLDGAAQDRETLWFRKISKEVSIGFLLAHLHLNL